LSRETPSPPGCQLRDGVGRARPPAAGLEQVEVVLGVAQGEHVAKDSQGSSAWRTPAPLEIRAARRERRPVVNDVEADSRSAMMA
jgi:hypothetical protein